MSKWKDPYVYGSTTRNDHFRQLHITKDDYDDEKK
jgi:hypothetical protein